MKTELQRQAYAKPWSNGMAPSDARPEYQHLPGGLVIGLSLNK